jgi:hypothetical protein
MDAPSRDDLFRIARDRVLVGNGRLTAASVEREGTDVNLMVNAAVDVGDEVIGQVVAVEASLFLDSARGSKLDRLVFDRCGGMIRKSAAAALGTATFTSPAAALAGFTIPSGTLLSTADGRRYITALPVVYPLGSAGPVSVDIRSVLAGFSQQAAVGTITSILGVIAGAVDGLSVTNLTATAGAADEETDDALRGRARAWALSVVRGTLAAIQTATLAVPGVVTATATEFNDAFGRPAGVVDVIISDAFTEQLVNVVPVPATYQTQSQALAAAVQLALDDARAAGVYVRVTVASIVLQSVVLALTFEAGVDTEAVAVEARARVVAIINSLSPGQPLQIRTLTTALGQILGLIAGGSSVLVPSGDIVTLPLQVLRTSMQRTTTASP